MKKVLVFLMSMVMMVGLLSGCSAFSDFNDQSSQYGPYIQSLLDVGYKGDAEVYLELVEDTQEEADGYYEDTMEYWAYELADYLQVVLINDELEARMESIMVDVFAQAKYEVADAVKVEDYYTVEVTIYPMLYTDMFYDEVVDFADDFQARTDAGEFGDIENDEEAYTAWEVAYANAVMDIMEKYTDQIEYDEPVQKIVKVTTDEDGYYGISEDDQMDLESYLLY